MKSTTMKIRIGALSTILVFSSAGTAFAGGRTPALTPGGQTIAGPGIVTMNPGETVTIGDGIDRDACATASNTSRSASISLQMIGDVNDSVTVGKGQMLSLCVPNTDTVQIECLGVDNICSANWRLDRN